MSTGATTSSVLEDGAAPALAKKAHIRMQFVTDGERTPGIDLVERLLTTGERQAIELTPEVAEQAIEALEHLQLPYLVDQIIESGERFAEQVHSRATRGLQEIVQNADDQGARNIRFGYRKRASRGELLVAHDGDPVAIDDVVHMAWPLLSGSREDPDKIGRFGIGLKTLNQFGEALGVHCPPLPGFEIRGGQIRRIRSPAGIRSFWDPEARETLFVLRLQHKRFDLPFFRHWLSGWDASSLLFLRRLERVSLVDLTKGRRISERAITVSKPKPVELDLPTAPTAEQVTIKDTASSRSWTRYTVRYPRPKGLRATHKRLGDTVRLQLAVPRRPEPGRLFVGLPLEETCHLPYSVNAPFEPNVDRTQLRDHNKLNEWLIARLGDLATSVSIHRFAERPKSAWVSVPLPEDTAGATEWTRAQVAKMVGRQRRRVAQKVRLHIQGHGEVRLDDLVYESAPFDGLLSAEEIERLWNETSSRYGPRRAVPRSWRDGGRWREVLAHLDAASPLWSSEILEILDWPEEDLQAHDDRWLVALVNAGLEDGQADELWERPCVALAGDGGRRSPADLAEGGALLVHTLPREGIAARLGLGQQITRAFRARNAAAGTVRQWLSSRNVLREKAGDADALRALARAEREDPIDLSRRHEVLRRLRNSFEQLPADERLEIGRGIGKNIAIAGFEFDDGGRKRTRPVRPAEAYLPSAIDKNEGWPAAAAQTPGLLWIDRQYSDVLKGARGQGALVTLKALGALTGPRLVPGKRPSNDPNATPLLKRRLCAQHKDELRDFPSATGLMNDWGSPDLDAVIRDLLNEKRSTVRRKRARALFLALDRAWDDQYVNFSIAQAVRHFVTWRHLGDVSATWVARLASEPWLSTREPRFSPEAPRDLTVLTPAAFEIEGERLESYVYEIEAEHVDSDVVAALQIQGRPFASSVVARLEELRAAQQAGAAISQAWVDGCYRALSSYCRGGPYAERSDLSERELRRAFSAGRGGSGLIRAGETWLAPEAVRREPFLDESLPHVQGAEALWDALGVKPPSVTDCVAVVRALAQRGEENRSSEVRVFRCLLDLAVNRRVRKEALASLPLHTYGGWQRVGKRPVYAVPSSALAEALGENWPVWRPPISLDELAPLLEPLKVVVLERSQFEPDIPSRVVAGAEDLRASFAAGVGHLKDYLAINHPALHDRLTPTGWRDLQQTEVVAGTGWSVKVRAPDRRTVRLTVRAQLFDEPLRLCLLHEDEIAQPDSGGQALASYFVGNDPRPEDRSTLALAWAYAFGKREEEREEIDLSDPNEPNEATDPEAFKRFRGSGARRRSGRRRPAGSSKQPERAPSRQLNDINSVDLNKVGAAFLDSKRRGRLKASPGTKLRPPRVRGPRGRSDRPGPRAGQRNYSDRDREDLAFDIVEAVLADSTGLTLEDIRDDKGAGADAVDRRADIWVELKTHGQEASDTLRFEPAEAKRADEKKDRYWLVVVWNLEKPRTPEFVVIPDPIRRLDTYLGRGLSLTGVGELAAQQTTR